MNKGSAIEAVDKGSAIEAVDKGNTIKESFIEAMNKGVIEAMSAQS